MNEGRWMIWTSEDWSALPHSFLDIGQERRVLLGQQLVNGVDRVFDHGQLCPVEVVPEYDRLVGLLQTCPRKK